MSSKKQQLELLKCREEKRQLRIAMVLLRLRAEANKLEPKPRHLADLTTQLVELYEEKHNA